MRNLALYTAILIFAVAAFSYGDGLYANRPSMSSDGRRILFSEERDGAVNILVYEVGNHSTTQLTHSPKGTVNFDAAFSPDGSRVVYARTVGDSGSQIYTINSDGSGDTRLTQNEFNDESPAFSQDGSVLTFARAKTHRRTSTFGYTWDDWDLYSMKTDGLNETRITSADYYMLCCASVFPDGNILFAAMLPSYPDATVSIYRLNVDDKRIEPLWSQAGMSNPHPVLSRDGSTIAFASRAPNGNQHIFVMTGKGKDIHQLTAQERDDSYPSFSSDGSEVLFLGQTEDTLKLMSVSVDDAAHQEILFPNATPAKQPMVSDDLAPKLVNAIEKGDRQAVEILLQKRANPNTVSSDGYTVLMMAALHGNNEIVSMLMKAGADVNAYQEKTTPSTALMCAALSDHVETARLLLVAGSKVNTKDGQSATALSYAAFGGNAEITKLLLRSGADPNVRDADGMTALMLAARSGDKDTVKALLDAHADSNVRDNDGHTAIEYASEYPEIKKLLRR